MRKSTQQFSILAPLERGLLALHKRDYPSALKAFMVVYQDKDWVKRDAALLGMSDILDLNTIEHQKPFAVELVTEWRPPSRVIKTRLADYRVLELMDVYLQPVLWSPRNLVERRTLRAFYETKNILERILLTDRSYFVRFSALMILTEQLGKERLHFIEPTLRRAKQYEKNDLVRQALAEYLGA